MTIERKCIEMSPFPFPDLTSLNAIVQPISRQITTTKIIQFEGKILMNLRALNV